MNLGETKVLIFHTSTHVMNKCHLTLCSRQVEVVRSYVNLRVTFSAHKGTDFFMTRGYAPIYSNSNIYVYRAKIRYVVYIIIMMVTTCGHVFLI